MSPQCFALHSNCQCQSSALVLKIYINLYSLCQNHHTSKFDLNDTLSLNRQTDIRDSVSETHTQTHTYVDLQDQWNGPYFFFLKSHISAPGYTNSTIFFPAGVYPLYLDVIIDFGHIWAPFMVKIEQMCPKSAFLVVHGQNH